MRVAAKARLTGATPTRHLTHPKALARYAISSAGRRFRTLLRARSMDIPEHMEQVPPRRKEDNEHERQEDEYEQRD